jgi:hypothetical protein
MPIMVNSCKKGGKDARVVPAHGGASMSALRRPVLECELETEPERSTAW